MLISRFSAIDGEHFRLLVETMTNHNAKNTLLYIPTASFAFDRKSTRSKGEQRRRSRYDAKEKMKLLCEAFRMEGRMLELDNTAESKLKEALEGITAIYVDGGNTFYLQKHVLKTNFWNLFEEQFKNSMCLYVGASAGAIVAGVSISTAYWKGWDDPDVGEIEWNDKTLKGRGLVDMSVFPHYDRTAHEELVTSKSATLDHGVLTIKDDSKF